jgi:hypothetical protein
MIHNHPAERQPSLDWNTAGLVDPVFEELA